MIRLIRWKGKDYYLITIRKNGPVEGAIATKEQYENFEPSTAHLYENGDIIQHGELIGQIEDLEFLGELK